MPSPYDPSKAGDSRARRLAGVASGSSAMLISMAAVGAPAPLAALYEARYGMTAAGLSGSFATYILCAALTLTLAGEVSDYLGRRPVIIAALVLTAVGCLALANAHDLGGFVGGRALQGAATGLGISAAGTFVIELAGTHRQSFASAVVSSAPTAGLTIGAVASGALAEHDSSDLAIVFVILAGTCGVIALGIAVSPETTATRSGVLRSLVPSLRVPEEARSVFVTACICCVAAYALGGLYQSIGPLLVDAFLHIHGTLFNGILVASVLGTSVIGAPLTARLTARHAMLVGLGAMAAGSSAIIATLLIGFPAAFFAASILGGLGFGAAFSGALRALLERSDAAQRAGLISAVYLVAYVGSSVGTFAVGALSAANGLSVPLFYLAAIAVLCLIGIFRPTP